jgi:hypothetical protein
MTLFPFSIRASSAFFGLSHDSPHTELVVCEAIAGFFIGSRTQKKS